jgi:hypothetical protein
VDVVSTLEFGLPLVQVHRSGSLADGIRHITVREPIFGSTSVTSTI